MSYHEHKLAAAQLSPAEMDNLLRVLAHDARFCAVVGWLERNRDAFVSGGSKQDLAGNHGKLAHAQGSVHAVNVLIAQIANLIKPPEPGGAERPPEE